jgi:hypothetical protein
MEKNPTVSVHVAASNLKGAPASTSGDIMTDQARQYYDDMQQMRVLEERANVLGKSTAVYVAEINNGRHPGKTVPPAITGWLIDQGLLTPEGNRLTEKGEQQGIPVASERLSINQLPELQGIQTVSSYADPNVAQHIPQSAPQSPQPVAPQQQILIPSTTTEAQAHLGVNVKTCVERLRNKELWKKPENLIKLEEIISGLLERNADHIGGDKLDKRIKVLNFVVQLMQELDGEDEAYLHETWLRQAWRTMLYRNNRRLGLVDAAINELRISWEVKMLPIVEAAEIRRGKSGDCEKVTLPKEEIL